MKTNKKSYTAGWVILILAIAAAVILGQLRKPSVRKKLQEQSAAPKPPAKKKAKEQER